ncbi:MAG: type II secretion system secretin GspD [Myxococcota bacterium]|nr:type II secretion system secretin GspD [Myxococcota bacterium]
MKRIFAITFAATLCAPHSGLAQDGNIEAGNVLDKRALSIPGKLPRIQNAFNKNKLKKAKPSRKKFSSPKSRPPAASGSRRTPGFGDIKKTSGSKCKAMKMSDKVQFEFKQADIKDIVTAISKTMCKNFIITQKVRSQKFDIISPTPITVRQSWRAFMSTLAANDFTLVKTGKYYKIVQSTDGTRSPVPMYKSDDSTPSFDRIITKIWKLENASDINQVVNYLNIFKSSKGQIHPFHPTRTIIATDYGTSMVRLERILNEIDQPGILEQVHLVPVEFAGAREIADILTQIFEPQKSTGKGAKKTKAKKVAKKSKAGAKGGGASGPLSISKIIAEERTNSLIIIASDQSFREIMELKKKLDVPGEADGLVHVLRLKHADAEELASTLSSLASGTANNKRKGSKRSSKRKSSAGSASAALFSGEVKITADKATNSLVITASKLDLQSVKKVIAQLDVPRFQVFVEAVIMEVSMKKDRNLGTSWHGGIPNEDIPIIFGSQHNELNALQYATNPLGLTSLLGFASYARGPELADSTQLGLPGGISIPSVGVVLQALQSSNDINVVSTPHLLTLDNEEAEIQVSEKRPFPAGLSLGGLGGLGQFANQAGAAAGGAGLGALGNLGGLGLGSVSINREDVGLTLKLKPQINDDEYVRLEIDQELSDVAGLDQVTQQTITSKRSAKTTVVVRDQDSVVIGGLVRDRISEDESKVPLFGDLPLIGWLFKRQNRISEKVNLLLVITPYIIRGPADFYEIYSRKMKERKEFVERFYGSTKEYSAQIDWKRKTGPLAKFRQAVNSEMQKFENGGDGTDGEELVTPDNSAKESSGDSDTETSEPKRIAPIAPKETEDVTPDITPADSSNNK